MMACSNHYAVGFGLQMVYDMDAGSGSESASVRTVSVTVVKSVYIILESC